MDACPENLAIVEDGCLLYANPAFAETFGYPHSSELHGLPLARVVPANHLLASESKAAGSPSAASDPAFVATCKDGSPRKVQMSCACFQIGKRDFLVLRLRECPAEEENAHSAQMEPLGRLVGAVAHDFNNLLTGILLYCDLLGAGLDSHNPLRSYVAEIRRAGGHSAELVQQLMAVARPQHDEPGANSWRQVISSMRNLLTRLLGENIELQMDELRMDLGANDDGERVAMDAAPMRQIILNVLLNARDAMPDGGSITLTVQRCEKCGAESDAGEPSCIVLILTDTGCGMDAATRARLFETFFTTKGAGKGTGLGLPTVGRIVKEHGGTIEVESELQKGTRIRVHLPRARRIAADEFDQKAKNRKRGNAL